jgi:curved DNA-binding protein
LPRSATQDEIKRAYRKLARKYHPDVSKALDADARFKELGEAYEVLKDPEKRAAYDNLGANWKAGQEFQPSPGGDAGFEFSGRGFDGTDASGFSDFFEALYGRRSEARRGRDASGRAPGEDRHARVLIDLEDAYAGTTRTITLQVPAVGKDGRMAMREHKLDVKIPVGICAGQHIRLAGQGAPGHGQGKAGDLYLEVGFRPHRHYRVEGRDVTLDVPVAPWEAVLGAAIKVPTPSGEIELRIPPGSAGGSKLRLKGRGIPGPAPGDFYVVLRIVLPPADTEAAAAFYASMAERFGSFNARKELGA